jgi:hypothetical protein
MEPIRLVGKERREWERAAIRRNCGPRQAVYRAILDYAAGKAQCWPSNKTIGGVVGIKPRAVAYALRALEAAGAIRCVERIDLPSQRVIVVLGHPGTREAMLSNARAARGRGYATDCTPPASVERREGVQSSADKGRSELEGKSHVVGRSDSPPDPGSEREREHEAVFRRFFGCLVTDTS